MHTIVYPSQTAAEIEKAISLNSEVTFAPGVYALGRALRLTGLTGRVLRGEAGAILTGAKALHADWNHIGERLYSANIGVGRTADMVRIGTVLYRMARYPHAKPGTILDGYAADALEFAAKCAHPEDGFIHAMHAHMWGDMHYRIDGRSANDTLKLVGGWQNNRPMGMHNEYMFAENLREALGAPGEFFYDRRTGELLVCADAKPESEVLIIENSGLIELSNCHDMRIEGLTFADSARTFMCEYEPLLRSDWCIYRGGAVFAEDCSGISISGCEFRDIGSNALFFSGNVSNCMVRECFFHDLYASAICFVGKPSSVRFPCSTVDANEFAPDDLTGVGPKSDEYVRDCTVENCLIRDIGKSEKQTACVEISMSARIHVTHCTMHTCPRAAINISEGTFGGHIIEYNDLFDTVRETGDHGTINGWGRDRFWHAAGLTSAEMRALAHRDAVETTVIRANRVRCDHGWDIDLDDGCSNYLVEDNLCLAGGLKFREGFDRTARGNRMINNTFHPHVWFENSGDVFKGNLVMRPYQPIGMPEHWGDCIDFNVLAVDEATVRPAAELQKLSMQDEHSTARRVEFDDMLNPLCDGLCINRDYGVTSKYLRDHATRCPIDAPSPLPTLGEGRKLKIGDVEFKSIETDGEMSAFATAGHSGVILTAVPPHSRWHRDGLRDNTAVVTLNGAPVSDAEQFMHMWSDIPDGGELIFGVRTMFNEAFEVVTRK